MARHRPWRPGRNSGRGYGFAWLDGGTWPFSRK
jgi:hypothetical protein